MPIHSTAPEFHDPDNREEIWNRTAKCGYVIEEEAKSIRYYLHQIWTPAELSRREDDASWEDEDGHALKTLYSRLCADCFPWSRDPSFIAELDAALKDERGTQ